MPELPEVETIKNELNRSLRGKVFSNVNVSWAKTIKPLTVSNFKKKLRGKKILGVSRRAKLLVFDITDQDHLVIHLKMTGQLIYRPKRGRLVVGGHPQTDGTDNLPNKYTRLFFTFTDGSNPSSPAGKLFFNDLRKFGWVKILNQEELGGRLARLGREPLSKEFTLSAFRQILTRYPRRKIKQLLMDQKLIAGVGNIYADEVCFAAHVLPARSVSSLKPEEIKDLRRHLIRILKLSISKKGTSSNNYRRSDGSKGNFTSHLKVYEREKQKCKRCRQGVVHKTKQGGRGTHFCPKCQE